MYSLQFDEMDLACNRQGELSAAQRARVDADAAMIRRQSWLTLVFIGGFVAFMLVVGAVIEFNNAGGDLNALFSETNRNALGVLVLGLGFIVTVAMLFTWWSVRRFQYGKIRTVEGSVWIEDKDVYIKGMKLRKREVQVRTGRFRKFTFRFQDARSLAYFRNGKRYRVYYLPYAIPQALSAERLDP